MNTNNEMLTLTVPRDLHDLARHWRGFILRELHRRGRAKFNAEDVLAHVLLKLCESRITEKFWGGWKEQSHQLTVTVEEAALMLGISVGDFLAFQVESDENLSPVNTKGQPVQDGVGYTSPSAIYLFTDVVALGASMSFPNQGVQVFPEPKEPEVVQWKKYLSAAVGNHSANFTRSYQRHEAREHAPDHFPCFRDEDGKMEFEDRLVDDTSESFVEAQFDVRMLLKQAPGLKTKKSDCEKSFFVLLSEGYTIREASKAVGLSQRERKVLAAHLSQEG